MEVSIWYAYLSRLYGFGIYLRIIYTAIFRFDGFSLSVSILWTSSLAACIYALICAVSERNRTLIFSILSIDFCSRL